MAKKKGHRDGGVFGGTHTTYIPAALPLVDRAADLEEVTNITAGFITSGLQPSHGQRRVKITDSSGAILLVVRGNISLQEIRIYSGNPQNTKLEIAPTALNENYDISFKNRQE